MVFQLTSKSFDKFKNRVTRNTLFLHTTLLISDLNIAIKGYANTPGQFSHEIKPRKQDEAFEDILFDMVCDLSLFAPILIRAPLEGEEWEKFAMDTHIFLASVDDILRMLRIKDDRIVILKWVLNTRRWLDVFSSEDEHYDFERYVAASYGKWTLADHLD